MITEKEPITVVWLKRDLRLDDNDAIQNALASGNRVLLTYVFEPMLLDDPHYSERHWDFIKQSLEDINLRLSQFNTKVLTIQTDIITAFNKLQSKYKVSTVFSHQETGILLTFNRDKSFKRFCKNNLIDWKENINNGIYRGLQNREQWVDKWEDYMNKPLCEFHPKAEQFINLEAIEILEQQFQTVSLTTSKSSIFQKGGTSTGLKYLESFLDNRYKNYMFSISKPLDARKSCSRLSPYLAWGNLSVRQVFKSSLALNVSASNKKQLEAFLSRLKWQAHFIQKFEMEHTMETESINKGYHKLKKDISKQYQDAWKTGNTGVPLVDACMRCLNETGYLNFRMRALVVSFFTHNLWQPWQEASKHLSQQFLDFEPGIHFPQLQMQAGETGISTLRIYNPIKNGLEHDPDAQFIKKWVPELKDLDTPFAHEPYLMTEMEQRFYNLTLGVDYPYPIVDVQESRKKASSTLWNLQKNSMVKTESDRILKKHTLSRRKM
uniref:deoxyribodipyrimidine photo-lyase/cryptochrome family protein n=2 Tax=Gelidibacter sp. TaxID=2018083 RepID=UPI00404B088D